MSHTTDGSPDFDIILLFDCWWTEIDIILSPREAQSFRDRINQDGTDAHAIDAALAHVRSEDSEASVQADLDAIRALIQQTSGGFGRLNAMATVKRYLRRWFVLQGGIIKTVARLRPSQRALPESALPRDAASSSSGWSHSIELEMAANAAPPVIEAKGIWNTGQRL